MSSSSIIKSGASDAVTPFRLSSIVTDSKPVSNASEAFSPIDFRKSTVPDRSEKPISAEAKEPGEIQPAEPGKILIDEAELEQKLKNRYLQGIQDGREQAEKGLDNVFKAMRSGIAELAGLREHILRGTENDLLKLSVMIARKVIQHEISCSSGILAAIVNSAVSDCIHLDRITIRLNPQDYLIVSGNRERFLGTLDPETKVILTSDETLSPGDCIIDSTTGVIDARVETQLEEIYRKFSDESGITSIEPAKSSEMSDN